MAVEVNILRKMLSIGDYIFSVYLDTDYHQLVRTAESGYSHINRAGQSPATQRTGKPLQKISITGQVLGITGGFALDRLRTLIDAGPQLVMKGNGVNLGQWTVVMVSETSERLIDDGTALKTMFKIELKEYQP
ncbi:phage tail protein [Gammaproteobacteria bacterium AS21]